MLKEWKDGGLEQQNYRSMEISKYGQMEHYSNEGMSEQLDKETNRRRIDSTKRNYEMLE